MNVETEKLAQLRLMRGYVGAALNIAQAMDDTLMLALFTDIEQTLTARVGALVTAPNPQRQAA